MLVSVDLMQIFWFASFVVWVDPDIDQFLLKIAVVWGDLARASLFR